LCWRSPTSSGSAPSQVIFEVDFVLTKAHPAYVPPPASARECFRNGRLRLVAVQRLLWDEQGARPATDATGERDYGHIDSFEWEHAQSVLSGDWGRMELTAGGIEVVLDDPPTGRISSGLGERSYAGTHFDLIT
jgi:hypothetical protein